MIHFSLFSGIGGFELASEWAGWKNYLSCEINPFGNKVLNHYWPDAYHHDDIHTLNYEVIDDELTKRYGSDWRTDDIILTGGFPCQPYSAAGKRLGKEDDRHLWPEMLRIIRKVQPTWVVGENVLGLVNWNGGLVFDEVQSDLEAEGYQVQPYVLPAAGVGAPHRRDRVWFVAYSINGGHSSRRGKAKKKYGIQSINRQTMDTRKSDGTSVSRHDTDTNRSILQATRTEQQTTGATRSSTQRTAPDTKGQGSRQFASENRGRQDRRSDNNGTISDASNANSNGIQGQQINTTTSQENRQGWKGTTQIRDNGDIEGWYNFPTQSPICGGDDGLPSQLDGITLSRWRNESIKAYGNAIVPQVAYQIFKAINEYGNI